MKCGNHPDREAATVCNACGKFICPDCRVQLKGTRHCRECVAAQAEGYGFIEHSPALAGILSFLIAGLGQVYNGQYAKGVVIFLTSWLIFPWVVGIFDAYKIAARIRDGEMIREIKPGCLAGSLIGMLAGLMIGSVIFVAVIAGFHIRNKAPCSGGQTKGEICETPGGEQ
ncbi:MAG: hypothetical protein MJA29_12390 [Candidatus Omnitrophica bacterium]|nr:hypothetical protein [Candidatus Omnitrophota bacterium]